jgi:hypothetical protein
VCNVNTKVGTVDHTRRMSADTGSAVAGHAEVNKPAYLQTLDTMGLCVNIVGAFGAAFESLVEVDTDHMIDKLAEAVLSEHLEKSCHKKASQVA